MSPVYVTVNAGAIAVFCFQNCFVFFCLIGFAEKPQQANKSEKSTEKETAKEE